MMSERYSIQWVDVHDIHEDRDNPNAMNEAEFNSLVSEIKLNGFLQPIVTRICKCKAISRQHRVIVSGEHRWRAAQHPDIAMKEVPCIDVDINDSDAKLLMVNLNSVHGNPIPLKLASLIVDLNKKVPTEELQKRLHMSKDQLLNVMYPKASESLKLSTKLTMKGVTKELKETALFTIALTRDQLDKVTQALEQVMKDKKCKRPEALITICETYQKMNDEHTGLKGE